MSTILLTKVTPPQSKKLLTRLRLLSKMEQSLETRLLLISASTGFGKTSLLADFVRNTDKAICWYSLEDADRDPTIFCRYILNSVRQTYPKFGASFEELLGLNRGVVFEEVLLQRLAEEFAANLQLLEAEPDFNETILVLDDYQFAESPAINQFVQRLIWCLPPQFHMIIASRVVPEGLSITRLLAKRMVETLGAKDLSFTREEVAQLLEEQYNIADPVVVDSMTSYSEGWVTAIILAMVNTNQPLSRLSNATGPFSQGILDAGALFDYLGEEVLESQSAQTKDFLLKTSVLNRLSPKTCDILLDLLGWENEANSEWFLNHLETRNLFITRQSNEGQTSFQYHALFRQFLLSRLRQDRKYYRKVQLAAAAINRKLRNYPEAVQNYVEANDIGAAASLLNEIAPSLYEAGQNALLAAMLDTIPKDALTELPHLMNVNARLLIEHGENQDALSAYQQAYKLYRRDGLVDFAARMLADQAQILFRQGQYNEAATVCFQVLNDYSVLMQTVEGQRAVAAAQLTLGIIRIEENDIAETEKNLHKAAEIYRGLDDTLHLAVIDSYFGQAYHHQGRLVKSNIFHKRALAQLIRIGNRPRELYSRTSIAINSFLQGNYSIAESQLNESMHLAMELKENFIKLYILAYLGNIYRNTERYSKAHATFMQGLELARSGKIRKIELRILNDRATTLILEGNWKEAQQVNLEIQELATEYNLPDRAAIGYRNIAWLEFSNRSYKRALSNIEKSLEIFNSAKIYQEEATSKFTMAFILMAMGEPRKALTALQESLSMCEDLGFEPFAPFELKWATSLLEYAARKKVPDVVEQFLRKHSYISGFDQNGAALPGATEEGKPQVEPIEFKKWQIHNQHQLEITPSENGNKTNLYLYSLDGGAVWEGKREISNWRTSKSLEILYFLAEHKKCTRDEILEALWPDEDLQTSAHLLRTNLFNLRKTIAPVEVVLNAGRYYLDGNIWYDADEFRRLLKESTAQSSIDEAKLAKIVTLYKRDYLSQFYSNWVIEQQQELLQLYIAALEKLIQNAVDKQQLQLAIPYTRELLIKDPYNENAHCILIKCYLETNNRSEALRQSNQCLRVLEELDLKPSRRTQELLQKLA